MARPLRPLVLGRLHRRRCSRSWAPQLGGVEWMVGGFLADIRARVPAPRLRGRAPADDRLDRRDPARRVWIRLGLGYVILIRDLPEHGRLAAFTVLLAVWAGDTRVLRRAAVRPAPLAPTVSPGKTWEGFVTGTAATIFVTSSRSTRQDFLTVWRVVRPRAALAVAAPLGDLFESALKRDWASRTPAGCSAGTAACSTASTRCSSPARPRTT